MNILSASLIVCICVVLSNLTVDARTQNVDEACQFDDQFLNGMESIMNGSVVSVVDLKDASLKRLGKLGSLCSKCPQKCYEGSRCNDF
jgi:hypothetical protein